MHRKGFLTRLRHDTRGNTLAIVGAALVPLAAMIGSGVDMSRAYMAKTRLQSACDAAALAGRRVMTDDEMTDAVENEARRFFNFNYPQGLYETAAFTPDVTRPEAGTVNVSVSTTIPTTVMAMFGFDSLPLDVDCEASLNFVNTDVMLVLDVTGSMDQYLSGTKKIVSLRDAVMALYDELEPVQEQLEDNGLRLRYGIVPYSSTVNVGRLLFDENPNYLADSVHYQSRSFTYDREVYEGEEGDWSQAQAEVYSSGSLTQDQCDKFGRNRSFGSFDPSPNQDGGPPPQPTRRLSYSNDESSGVDWGWDNAPDHSRGRNDDRMSCRRWVRTRTTTYPDPPRYAYSGTNYQEERIDTSRFKRFEEVRLVTSRPEYGDGSTVAEANPYDPLELARDGDDVSTSGSTWNGCIEERKTVDTITSDSGYSIPDDALDLNINMIPDSADENTQWRPMWPRLVYRHDGSSMNGSACPAAAVRLQAWTHDALQSYVDGLQPVGSTYHDIGMIWGARMISSGGIFADSPDTFGSMPVSRHIIFMTDGQMDTDNGIYAFQGIERDDRRVSGQSNPSESDLNGRHMQRFKMVCNAAKGLNVSIWVIAFGTTLTNEMRDCASNTNQASTIGNRDELIARFRQIGSQIGALRLTQ